MNANVVSSGIMNFLPGGVLNGTLGITGGNWNGQGVVTGVATVSSGVLTIGSAANMKANSGLLIAGSGTLAAIDAITANVNYTASSLSNFSGSIPGTGKTLTLDNAAATFTGGGFSGGNVILGSATLSVGGDNSNPGPNTGMISGSGGVTKIFRQGKRQRQTSPRPCD